MSIRNTLIALVVGIVIGAGAGLYFKGKVDDAAQVKSLVQQRKEDVHAVDQTRKAEELLQQKLQGASEQIANMRRAIQRHRHDLAQGQTQDDQNPTDCANPVLSVGTVRMLNAARANEPFDTDALGNAESKAPSEVEVADIIDSDIEVVGMYHDLAERHNALVDWVEQEIQKHNRRIESGQ